jgi:hypothetical protein
MSYQNLVDEAEKQTAGRATAPDPQKYILFSRN